MIVEFTFSKKINPADLKKLTLFLYRFKRINQISLDYKPENDLHIFDLEVNGKKHRSVEPTFSMALKTLWKYCKKDAH